MSYYSLDIILSCGDLPPEFEFYSKVILVRNTDDMNNKYSIYKCVVDEFFYVD
jgi:hypothetical protein